ncbi:MAG: MG2 domain-containing protein [Promethearchaeota archaeon]
MKRKILSILLLLLLNFNVFFTIGFSQSVDAAVLDNNLELTQENSSTNAFDVEREIQAIEDQLHTSSPSNYQPGPLNTNNISADPSYSLKDQERGIIINIDLEKQVISPGTPLNYVIQVTRGFKPVPGEILYVDIIEGEYYGWYFYWLEDYIPYEERIVWTSASPITTDSNGEYQGQFTPPSSGRYSILVRTSSSDYVQETRSFTVANIALFWRVSSEYVSGEHHYSVAYVLNSNDFSPVPNAEINLAGITYDYDYEHSEYEVQTTQLFSGISDDKGIIEIDFIPPSSISENYYFLANLSASYNGETVYVSRDIYRGGYYWGWDGYTEYQKYDFIVTTDKPIYSPGETIQTRILLWKNDYLKATKEPAQTSFILKFLSPSQHVLLHRQVTTNSYGVATYSFTLNTDSELGSYSIITQKEDIVSSLPIRVDKYEKPSFRVTLGLDHEYVAPGGKVSGNITAEYYFGKPVSNGEVELSIGDLDVLIGLTDIDGFWEFEYKLPGESSLEGMSAISINVTVIDTVGREVAASSSVQITDEIYVWAYINPWFPKVDENVTVYFGAYQYSDWGWSWWNWRVLANAEVEIKLYGVISDTNYQLITTLKSRTDINGQGQKELDLSRSILTSYNRFRGIVEMDTGDGREGSSTFYFTVDRNSVEVDLGASTYQAGDELELEVFIRNVVSNTSIDGSLQFRIFDSDYDLIGEDVKEISSQGATIEFQLSSNAPNGKYIIYCYLETTFDSEYGSWTYYRFSKSVEFHVGATYEISLTTDKKHYSLADSISISGQLQGQTKAPVMVQFVKKGIVLTEYIDVSSDTDFDIQIQNTQFLAPRFWVYSFAILDDGTILETSLSLEIDTTLIVEVWSDKSVYEPGDMAKISIQILDSKNNDLPAVLVVSFIDSSVFGVQPDPEAEREHFKEQEYWPSVWTVVSWKNQQRSWWFWWWDLYPIMRGGYFGLEDMGYTQEAAEIVWDQPPGYTSRKDAGTDESAQTNREIRDNLPENAYWSPLVIVENGYLEIDLILPDTIGEWTVRVVATTQSGQGVLHKYSFKTFLPFFVEIDKEPFVLQDDVFIIKGIVYNYLDELDDIEITLEIETEAGILVLGRNIQTLRLPSGFLGSIGWACLAQGVGFFNITLYGSTLVEGTSYRDAIRKSLEIVPNGVTYEVKAGGFISADPSFSYVRYSEAAQQSEFLELSLGLGSIALSSWERLIKYPYGCTEQTISCLIPDALVLKYLKELDQLTNETEESIRDMVVSGLSRLYSQQHNDGGWGWWYDDSSRVYMTSLVLYGLGIVNRSGFYIDPNIVKEAITMISTHQNSDGYWVPDSWRGVDQTSFTAFVLRSILQWNNLFDATTVSKALNYITNAWNNDDSRSTYLACLYLDSVPGSGFGESSFETTLLTYLKNEVKLSSDGNYWTYTTDGQYWRSLGGDVEITALALIALVKNDPAASMPIIRSAVQWLLQRQSWYGWGNTADTAAAISAIVALSQSEVSSDEDTKVTLIINGNIIGSYDLSTSSQPTIYLDLEEHLLTGDNIVELEKQGVGNVSYYFYGNQILRSLPSIKLQTEISGAPGQQVTLPLTLTPTSSQIFAFNLSVIPLEGDLTPINLPQSIDQLTQQTEIKFNYATPSQTGIYEIPGFEITYQLSNLDQTEFSPGIITRRYGPVQLTISESLLDIILDVPSFSVPSLTSNDEKVKLHVSSSTKLELTRTYSQMNGFQRGDLVTVTLSITNTKQVENFLMVEDYIPIGFELDKSTIKHSAETFEITTSGITFFFPELKVGTTQVSYGVIAMNVRQSLVSPARLSSMYDEWEVKSLPVILGDTRISIDSTGAVVQDFELPTLEKITIKETYLTSKTGLGIEVTASDNWGIAGVRVFIKQSDWNVFECSKEIDEWRTIATGISDGDSQIYLEIIDFAGNVLVSDSFSKYIELEDLFIPEKILPVLGLISVALVAGIAAGITSTMYLRKKRR